MAQQVYAEPARSYASLWFFVALLAAGFGFDLALGGGIAHLAGWILAFVLVVGLNFVILYAVRATKSLRLTADELRVGDEAIGRAEIVGVTPEPVADAPVLGWPNGRPRRIGAITVRLFDGQDVVVPTRFPARLAAALAVGTAPPRTSEVRAATRAELLLLAEIDDRSRALFRTAGYAEPAADRAMDGAVFVAGQPPVGYVRVIARDGDAELAALAVIPGAMRQGVGTALLDRACEWARTRNIAHLTAVGYPDVSWSGPFLAARGFVVDCELAPDEVGRRVLMRRALSATGPDQQAVAVE
jgi:GNAT superfamily N-acetyltransferase